MEDHRLHYQRHGFSGFWSQVIEHVEDLKSIADEIFRILTPGDEAILLFLTKNMLIESHMRILFIYKLQTNSIFFKVLLFLKTDFNFFNGKTIPRIG